MYSLSLWIPPSPLPRQLGDLATHSILQGGNLRCASVGGHGAVSFLQTGFHYHPPGALELYVKLA